MWSSWMGGGAFDFGLASEYGPLFVGVSLCCMISEADWFGFVFDVDT